MALDDGTCGGCPARWSGKNMCHCSGCHNTFSVERWFVFHRRYNKCTNPATLKIRDGRDGPLVQAMKQNNSGTWVGAVSNPRFTED